MLGNLANCLSVTLQYEGGWSDHPKDPGGATMKGITLATFRQYRPNATKTDLKFITPVEVEMIYRHGYWRPISGDDLPPGVDLATFDFGVNSGPARAAKHLQAVVGVGQDGKIGPATVAATKASPGKEVIQRLCGRRLSFVRSLGTFSTFGKGWSRRIADVEARAVAMFLTATMPAPALVEAALQVEADHAQVQARQEVKSAAGSVAGGGAVSAVDVATSAEPNWMLIGAAVAIVVAAVTVFVARSQHQKERAAAYARLAAA